MSYKLKYKGEKIDELLDKVNDTFGNSKKTITLSSWVDNECVYEDAWLEEGYSYTISYTDTSYEAFKACGIRSKTSNEAGQIVFYCDSTPSDDVEVLILKVAIDG